MLIKTIISNSFKSVTLLQQFNEHLPLETIDLVSDKPLALSVINTLITNVYNDKLKLRPVLHVLTVSPQKFLLLEVLQAAKPREYSEQSLLQICSQHFHKWTNTLSRWGLKALFRNETIHFATFWVNN